jgi:hypothetical protein
MTGIAERQGLSLAGINIVYPARTRQRQAGHQQPGTINQN